MKTGVIQGLTSINKVNEKKKFCMTVAPPLSVGLITMFVFTESSFSGLRWSGSVLFFLGQGGMLSCRPSSFIVMTVSRLMLPIGGLYLP